MISMKNIKKEGVTITRNEIFKTELGTIKDQKIFSVAKEILQRLPEYFFKVPASSTGKYHPKYATGDGGLVRHTKAAVKIANELLGLEQNEELNKSHDIIILALIVHDGLKHGENGGAYSISEHPVICSEWLKRHTDLTSTLTEEQRNMLYGAVASHMGQWVTDYKTEKVILPKPITDVEKFVHLCDYLASRKWIEVDFEDDWYDGRLEADPDLTEAISSIIRFCKEKISSGVERESLYTTIQNIAGVTNPNKIKDVQTAHDVLEKLREEIK